MWNKNLCIKKNSHFDFDPEDHLMELIDIDRYNCDTPNQQ